MEVRGKGKKVPWPGGPGGPLGIMRRCFLRGGGGGQGLPPPTAEDQGFLRVSTPPGRCFPRVPPEPPGHNKTCTGPPVTEGLQFVILCWLGWMLIPGISFAEKPSGDKNEFIQGVKSKLQKRMDEAMSDAQRSNVEILVLPALRRQTGGP